MLPNDTAEAIVGPINATSKSINIRMFVFTSQVLVNAVVAARERGVTVRVMLNLQRRSGLNENDETRRALLDVGIEVRDSSPQFALTHQKSMMIDNEVGFVESLNWEDRDLTKTRDYAVIMLIGSICRLPRSQLVQQDVAPIGVQAARRSAFGTLDAYTAFVMHPISAPSNPWAILVVLRREQFLIFASTDRIKFVDVRRRQS